MSRSRSGARPRVELAAPTAFPPPYPWIWALAIVVVGVGTFWNSVNGPFIWDDQISIVSNPTIRHLWPLSDPLSPPRETPVAGRPLVNLSFAINYALGGVAETGYHVGNVSVHIACALLLFGIVRRTLSSSRVAAALGPPLETVGLNTVGVTSAVTSATALVVALLWMVHPLQSEPVNYLTQRSESLMTLFFLLTLYCAIRGTPRTGPRPQHRAGWQWLSVIACVCGMATKETMVVAPIVIVLYDWAFAFDSFRDALRARRMLYGGLAATWVVLGTLVWNTPRSTVGWSTTVGPWTYLLNQTQMIGRYLRLVVWPHGLVLDYGLPRALTLREVVPSAAVILALLAATGVALVRWRMLGALGAMFFLTLAPTSSVVPIGSEVGAERRMYLPFAALATLIVVVGRAWLERHRSPTTTARGELAGSRRHDRARLAGMAVTACTLAGLSALTIMRNTEYASPLVLWTTVVDRFPHGRARMAVATELASAGRHTEAIAVLRQAVPDFPDARAALGTELILENQHDEGVRWLRQFITDGPNRLDRIPAHVILAKVLASKGALDEVAGEWRAILAIAPTDPGARQNLARALSAQAQEALRRGDAKGGEAYAKEAVQLNPTDASAHNLLGVALASNGRLDDAITQFKDALRLAPNDTQTRNNLERALSLGRTSH